MADDLVERLAGADLGSTEGILSFADKKLKLNTADDAAEICAAIRECKNIRSLVLEGNTLGVDAAEVIGQALESHSELQQLHGKDLFTGRSKLEIPRALSHLGAGLITAQARLTVLDLSDNAVGPVGMDGLDQLLSSPVCYTLQQLLLNNNGWGPTGGVRLADCLLSCFHSSVRFGAPMRLRVFVSGRSRLENPGAIQLAKLFKLMGSMEKVVMPQNGIYHDGVRALAEALSENKSLQHLDLNDNLLTPKGAAALASSLSCMRQLRVLNLDDCLLKNAGAESIARSLSSNSQLQELHLSHNEIGVSAALSVVNAVADKKQLQLLQLDGNQLGEEGVQAVEQAARDAQLQDALQSLEEDEGEPDSDEEEGEDDEDGDGTLVEDEEGVENSRNDDDDIEHLQLSPSSKSGHPLLPKIILPKQCTMSEFLCQPSIARFLGLGDNRAVLFNQELEKITNIDEKYECVRSHLSLLSALCRVDLSQTSASDLQGQVNQLVDLVVRSAVEITADDTQLLANCLLVYMGLIKCEDKKFAISWDLRGLLRAVARFVKQPGFPADVRNTLQVFLLRPDTVVDKYVKEKSALLQALYTT